MESVISPIAAKRPINYKMNFIILVLARITSNLGTSIFNFGLGLYVLDITGSPGAFSMVLSFSILPGMFVNILGGAFVDRHNKKKIMVITDMLSGAAVFVYLGLFKINPSSMALIIAYVITLNIIQSFFRLAVNASVPDIVEEKNVARANSAFQATGAVVNIVGPIIGAIAYKAIGMKMIFILNAISFILSALGEIFLQFIKNTKQQNEDNEGYFESIKAVFKYLNTNKVVKFLFIFAVVVNFIYNPLMSLVIRYINYNIVKISGLQLSIVQASWAIGSILGALYVSMQKSNNRLLKKFFILLQIQAILIAFWAFPKLISYDLKWTITIVFGLILVIIGVLNTVQNIPIITYFQVQVPEDMRARIFGVFNTALLASSPLGMWVYGLAMEKINWAYITTISASLMALLSLYASRNKDFRQFILNLK